MALVYHINMPEFQLSTISLSSDILAGMKIFFAPFQEIWLVSMASGYHFEFFMTILKLSVYMLSI